MVLRASIEHGGIHTLPDSDEGLGALNPWTPVTGLCAMWNPELCSICLLSNHSREEFFFSKS